MSESAPERDGIRENNKGKDGPRSWLGMPWTRRDSELEEKWRAERGQNVPFVDEKAEYEKELKEINAREKILSSGLPYSIIEPEKKKGRPGKATLKQLDRDSLLYQQTKKPRDLCVICKCPDGISLVHGRFLCMWCRLKDEVLNEK